MSDERMIALLASIIAAGQVRALPARSAWPVHRAVAWVAEEAARRDIHLDVPIDTYPDPDVSVAVIGVEDALQSLADQGVLLLAGQQYAARWQVDEQRTASLLGEPHDGDNLDREVVTQAGHRLATWASIALKNAETAVASWDSTVRS